MNIPDRMLFKCNEPPLSVLAEARLAECWPPVAEKESTPRLPEKNADGSQTKTDSVRYLIRKGYTREEVAEALELSIQQVVNICRKHKLDTAWVVQRWNGVKWLYVCEGRTREAALDAYGAPRSEYARSRKAGKVRCIKVR